MPTPGAYAQLYRDTEIKLTKTVTGLRKALRHLNEGEPELAKTAVTKTLIEYEKGKQ